MKYGLILILMFVSSITFAKEAKLFVEKGAFISGYDPIAYVTENKAVKGSEKYSTEYKGAKIHFSSEANKAQFLKDPQKHLPAYNGWCAYAMADSGDLVDVDPKSFRVVNGKVYLFYNGIWANTLKKWTKKDDKPQIVKADQNWKAKHSE